MEAHDIYLNYIDQLEKEYARLPVSFYICPNQFDCDDEASEKACFDDGVNTYHETEKDALDVAKRLAAMVGHRVYVDIAVEFPSGRKEHGRYAMAFMSGEIKYV